MSDERLELRMLRPEDESSFREAVEAFRRETPPFSFAFGFDGAGSFAEYASRLEGYSRGIGVPENFVPNTFLVGVVAGAIVGRLSLRHTLNEGLANIGGHIGYGVVPSQRRRGFASEMLRQAIPRCAALGIERALITCDVDNVASRRVIEGCGGIFERIIDDAESGVPKRRYWLPISVSRAIGGTGVPAACPAPLASAASAPSAARPGKGETP